MIVSLEVEPCTVDGDAGDLEDVARATVIFLAANATVGPAVIGYVIIGSELMQAFQISAPPGLLSGLLVSEGIVWLGGYGMLIPAAIAGVATNSLVESRLLNERERELARSVFDDTLPFERIYITNLYNPGDPGRAFTLPQPDGGILINVGDDCKDPLGDTAADGGLPALKQTFIHELVHA